MTMLTKVQNRLVICSLCIVSAMAWGEREKPTTMQACNKPDCHNQFEMKEDLHGPIALGECTVCHKPDDVKDSVILRIEWYIIALFTVKKHSKPEKSYG